jgi:multiple sugar transport system permease protein
VAAILSMIFSWNELLYAMILTPSDETRTAPVTALSFLGGYATPWGDLMAAGSLIVLPVIVFAVLVSRYLVRGLTLGAVK